MIGPLIQRIRYGHGDSIRDAAAKAGVDYSVLRRLERDLPIRNRSAVLDAFARAYGLNPNQLDREDSAPASFWASLAAMDDSARSAHARSTFERRVLVALDWAVWPGGAAVAGDKLAEAAGMTRQELAEFRSACRLGRADRGVARRLARALDTVLKIPPCWFIGGVSSSEVATDGLPHILQATVDWVRQVRPSLGGRQGLAPIRQLHEVLRSL